MGKCAILSACWSKSKHETIATLLGMGQGELLKLARLTSQDGALVAIEFLAAAQQSALMGTLSWMNALSKDLDAMRISA